MPLNSAEVAATIGQYQQGYAGQQQHASLIGNVLNAQGAPQQSSQDMAGGIMNRAMAIGAPVASFGVGLAGLDPVSMGMSGFSAGSKLGMGAAGAGALGLAGAGIIGGGAMAAQYGVQQMVTGAQQQQAFNQAARQTFFHQTPYGQGFGTGQLNQMGGMMRHMAGEQGPGGELSSFREMSSIALRMGQMGQMTGVRDVQEFTKKFKEMVTTLKTVAREMGTSLEAAQEFTQSMKSAGVFRAADQMRVAKEMRGFSIAGNVAVSELSAMGNIGSQISRSIGGRGTAGMYGGMRTLGQVGLALQTGALSEENIYNATGLTGAEGRQAYATAQMSSSASFLKGRFGRMFLASVAGEDGELDAGAVATWQGGGVGVGGTRGMIGKGLGRAGRAGFLRNEGKLRGAALGQFGGNLPVMAMQNWLNSKGMDVESMDPREMILMSRMTGIGMDQLEGTMEQLKNMPQMQAQQRMSGLDDKHLRDIAMRRRTTGVEGIKRKFEKTREDIQAKLQQVGANIYTDLSSSIEIALGKMMGTASDEAHRDILQAYESARVGNMAGFDRVFGGGAQRAGAFKGGAKLGGASALSAGAGRWTSDKLNDAGLFGMGTSMKDRMNDAGYGSFFSSAGLGYAQGAKKDAAIQAGMQRVEETRMGVQMRSGAGEAFGLKNAETIAELYTTTDIVKQKGRDRIDTFQKFMSKRVKAGDLAADAELQKFEKMSDMQKAAYVSSVERMNPSIASEAQLSKNSATPEMQGGGAFASREEMSKALRDSLTGEDKFAGKWSKRGYVAGAVVGTVTAGVFGGTLWGGAIGEKLGGWLSGEKKFSAADGMSREQADKMADIFMGEKGRDTITGLNSPDAGVRKTTRGMVNREITKAKATGDMASEKAWQSMAALDAMATEREAYAKSHGGAPLPREAIERIAAHYKVPHGAAGLLRIAATANEAVKIKQDMNTRALLGMVGGEARQQREQLVSSGAMRQISGEEARSRGALTAEGQYTISSDLAQKMGKGALAGTEAVEATAGMFRATALRAKLGQGGDTELEREQLRMATTIETESRDKIRNMSPQAQQAYAQQLREAGAFGMANMVDETRTFKRRIDQSIRRKGATGGLASVMGISIGRKDQAALNKLLGRAQGGDTGAGGTWASEMLTRMGGGGHGAQGDAIAGQQAVVDEAIAKEDASGKPDVNKLASLREDRERLSGLASSASAGTVAAGEMKGLLEKVTAAKSPGERAKAMEQVVKSDQFKTLEKQRKEEAAKDSPEGKMLDALEKLPSAIGKALTDGRVLKVEVSNIKDLEAPKKEGG